MRDTSIYFWRVCNTPVSVVRKEKYLNFVIVIQTCCMTLHIVKVFFAGPFLKMWKFSLVEGCDGTTLTFV